MTGRTADQERKMGVDVLMRLTPRARMLALIPSHELQEQFGVDDEGDDEE